MKRSSFILKYQKHHLINWSSNPISRIDVGWIDFLFQFSQWSIYASVSKVFSRFRFNFHFRVLHLLSTSFTPIYYPNQPHLSFFQHQMEKRKVEKRNLRFSQQLEAQQNPHKHAQTKPKHTPTQQPTNHTLTQHTFETYFNHITTNN